MRKARTAPFAVGAAVLLGALACLAEKADGPLSTATALRADARANIPAVRDARDDVRLGEKITSAALHARNPHSWVGDAHNEALASWVAELRAGSKVDPCGFVADWFSDPKNARVLDTQVGPRWRSAARGSAVLAQPCGHDQRRYGAPGLFQQISFVRDTLDDILAATPIELGTEAAGIMTGIETAVYGLTNPSSLASALSPLLDSALALEDTLESAVLTTMISVAQSSAEFWYADSYAELQTVAVASAADLNSRCYSGELEGSSYDAQGTTYTCNGGYWYASASTGSQHASPILRLVGRGGTLKCEISKSDAYVIIGIADALGAGYGGIRGARFGLWGVGIGATLHGVRASAGGAWTALASHLFCELAE